MYEHCGLVEDSGGVAYAAVDVSFGVDNYTSPVIFPLVRRSLDHVAPDALD